MARGAAAVSSPSNWPLFSRRPGPSYAAGNGASAAPPSNRDHANDRQIEDLRKLEVALVVRRQPP